MTVAPNPLTQQVVTNPTWLGRDRTVAYYHDFNSMLVCYGMPAIVTLCSKLLNQMRRPKTDNNNDAKFSCSEVVKAFPLTVGFLEWIKPMAVPENGLGHQDSFGSSLPAATRPYG